MDHYLQKTFYKTASLIANSCKAIAILSGQSRDVIDIAWDYGKNLGLAFQVRLSVLVMWFGACGGFHAHPHLQSCVVLGCTCVHRYKIITLLIATRSVALCFPCSAPLNDQAQRLTT